MPLSSRVAGRILEEFRRQSDLQAKLPPEEELSVREMEVLRLVAGGVTNKEVADALFISENTVKFHMKNILDKLHLQNRAQVIAWAARRHWQTP